MCECTEHTDSHFTNHISDLTIGEVSFYGCISSDSLIFDGDWYNDPQTVLDTYKTCVLVMWTDVYKIRSKTHQLWYSESSMMVFRRDPCGFTCLFMTYGAVIYADYVVTRWILFQVCFVIRTFIDGQIESFDTNLAAEKWMSLWFEKLIWVL